jgi:hypothetical protein
MSAWGETRGNQLGYKIFVLLIKNRRCISSVCTSPTGNLVLSHIFQERHLNPYYTILRKDWVILMREPNWLFTKISIIWVEVLSIKWY